MANRCFVLTALTLFDEQSKRDTNFCFDFDPFDLGF